jgi:hypothetical protein
MDEVLIFASPVFEPKQIGETETKVSSSRANANYFCSPAAKKSIFMGPNANSQKPV